MAINNNELNTRVVNKIDSNVIVVTINFPSPDGIRILESAFRIRAEYYQQRQGHYYMGDQIFEITNDDLDKICNYDNRKEFRFFQLLKDLPTQTENYSLLDESNEMNKNLHLTWKQLIFTDASKVKEFVINLINKIDKVMQKPQHRERTIISAKDFFDQ